MNMIMDSGHLPHPNPHAAKAAPSISPQHRAELHITTSTPSTSPILNNINHQTNTHITNGSSNNNNNNTSSNNNNISESQISPITIPPSIVSSKSTLKRSFDVAFLMMPDERVKQKQQLAEKQARFAETISERHQYPTDLSPRQQQQQLHHQLLQDPSIDLFSMQEARRYSQISVRSPRIYDDPTVVIPAAAAAAAAAAASAAAASVVVVDSESQSPPMRSAFTKVTAASRLESPVPPPPLSPSQLSCPSMSPPVATTPPRTNSGNGSLSNGSSSSAPACLNPNIVYQNFRPVEYQFNGAAFQSVNQVHVLHAHRLKQQLMYRPQLNGGPMSCAPATTNGNGNCGVGAGSAGSAMVTSAPPSEFLPAYAGFPFPAAAAAAAAASPFAAAASELPRIVQNPAAAAILSTLIPPTLASTFSLTAQNVCAKCNISFRMTSDLVYHMRSHHKSEVACDPNRRKREEKLRCPVCQESFRERHHLTRHMTAHQDKESDQVMPNAGGGGGSSASIDSGSIHIVGTTGRHYGPTRLTGASAASK